MKRLTLVLLMAAVLATPAHAGGRRGLQAPPRLFEPAENIDLRGKSELLFRWGSEGGGSGVTEYQFKLYKGTQTVEAGLIKSESVPSSMDRISLPSELFEDGQTYTWQIRGSGSSKTRPAYTNFKVQK